MDKEIQALCKRMKLPGVYASYERITRETREKQMTFPEFLLQILRAEASSRDEKGILKRINAAHFPVVKRFESLDEERLPKEAQERLPMLKNLDFLSHYQNVVLIGNSGSGKTHLAISMGVRACEKGYRVIFRTVAGLINELKEAKNQKQVVRFERSFSSADLVILDELGYLSFDLEGAELLFEYLALRYEQKSTVITSNLIFSDWIKIFKDQALTMALLDRITQNAIILNMNGPSYRREIGNSIEKRKNLD
ncbi:MAG: IS21-like element helper ATPase IstB [Methanosarcina sp.]|nr:IS21-like element helper ATPase IstB [Methanosarcina sp.]